MTDIVQTNTPSAIKTARYRSDSSEQTEGSDPTTAYADDRSSYSQRRADWYTPLTQLSHPYLRGFFMPVYMWLGDGGPGRFPRE